MSASNLIRINKFLSESGYCSRREADKLIAQNRVLVNGTVPQIGTKISHSDVVKVDGQLVNKKIKESV